MNELQECVHNLVNAHQEMDEARYKCEKHRDHLASLLGLPVDGNYAHAIWELGMLTMELTELRRSFTRRRSQACREGVATI